MIDTLSPWPRTTIGKQFDVQLGKRFDAAVNRGEPRLCITNRGVRWGRVEPAEVVIAPLTTQDLKELRLVRGDILVCEGGEIGRASIWNDELPECYFANTLHRLRAKVGYEPRLVVAYLEYLAKGGHLLALVGKSSLAHLTKENLVRVVLPLPPSYVQTAVAEIIGTIDEHAGALERLVAKKRSIKQGVMQKLLTGHTRLPGFTGAWTVRQVGDFAQVKAGGTPSTSVARFWGGDIRWMSSGEIHQKRVHEVQGRITAVGLGESSAYLLPVGTVLMALAGQGKTRGTVAVSRVELSTNQSIAGIFPSSEHDPDFLYYNLDARYDELRGESAGDGGRGGLNLTIIKKLTICLPELAEQSAIAGVLMDVDDEIEALMRRLEGTRAIKQGMMQELLTGRNRLSVEGDAA